MSEPVATFRRTARWYGAVCGVVDVSLEIPATVVGLLGPNGAGKSTLLKLLTGQLRPSGGEVRVFGRDPATSPGIFRRLGFCSEDDALFDDLSARGFLLFLARLHGFRGPEARRKADQALGRLDLETVADRPCGGLSKGNRQRVRLAAAIVHEPEFLVLDEPMTGLDPLARRNVLDLVETWARAGRAVLFSSHILHEVEAAARHVVVVHKGMVLAEGSVAHLHACLGDYAYALEVRTPHARRLGARCIGEECVTGVSFPGPDRVRIESGSARTLTAALPRWVVELGLGGDVASVEAPDENLETLFQRLIA